jgi:hypothetical protein
MADSYLASWRQNIPGSEVFASVQNLLADSIYNSYVRIPLDFTPELVWDSGQEEEISNYPNPFNSNTTIDLSHFDKNDPIEIKIYDIMGREVKSLSLFGGHENHLVWDGRDDHSNSLSSGVYLIRAASQARSATVKALLIK